MEDTLSKFIGDSTKRHEENSNLIKEIRASTDAAIRNQGASIKTLEIQIRKMCKVLQERGFGSLPSSTKVNPRDQVKSISTTIEADSCPIRQKKGSYGPQFLEAYSEASRSIPQKEKDPGRASISVMPLTTYRNLGLGELAHTKLTVELADKTVKYPKRIAENVLVGIGKFTFPIDFIILDMPEDIKVPLILGRPFFLRKRMELDLEVRLIGETLVLNRSLNPFLEDYIELNDLNETFELRRNQGDDLMPTIEEGEVIEKFRTRDDELNVGIDDYPSYCDYDKKIHTGEGFDTPRDGFGKYKLVLVVNNLVLLAFISTASFEYYHCQGFKVVFLEERYVCVEKILESNLIWNMDAWFLAGYRLVHDRRSTSRIFKLPFENKRLSEEEEEAMAETMKQYMSKTQTDYGSGVAMPKIDNKDQFELKGQFLKELQENKFSGSDNEDAIKHIEKVLEIVNLFHVPNITVDQLMLQVFPISLPRSEMPYS
ncbi:hypothetical protein Tco_0575946 [Tanacetum coccineum]